MYYLFINLVIACSEKSIDSASHNPLEVDTSSSLPPEPDPDPIPKGGVEGQVLFLDGTPAENVMVQMCSSSCYAKVTDSNGTFSFGSLPATQYTMQSWNSSDPTMSTPTAPILIEEGIIKALEPWVFPHFVTQEGMVEARSYELERGIQLSIDPNTLSSGPYSLSEDAIISSVYVDPQSSGIPFDAIEGEVLALWHLGTYDLQLSSDGLLGGTYSGILEGETELFVYTASNNDKSWKEEGRILVDSEQNITMLEGSISQLTTLIFVQK